MAKVTLEEEVWADKNGNPVPFGSEQGATVLYGAGALVDEEEHKRVTDALKAFDAPPADKAVKGPAKTK